MNYLPERVQTICDQLKRLTVKQALPTPKKWQFKKGQFFYPEEADQDPTPYSEFDNSTMHWYGPDNHYWFKNEVVVPEEFDGKPLWIKVSSQFEGGEDMRNPQFLLFVNGEVTQGMDVNHLDVLLSENAKAGDVYKLDVQAYSGTLYHEFNFSTALLEIDPEIKDLYYDLQIPLQAFKRLEDESLSKIKLTKVLNDAVNLLDLRVPYSEEFYASVRTTREFLAKDLYTDLAGEDEVIASCIGHTHIDVAWWWTVSQTKEKVVRSFATVLKLMEEYPDYKFLHSTPQVYSYVKERYPEMFERIKERVKEGRWEPEGANWVEMDTNISSGESLTRQMLYGKKFNRENFGCENRVYWLPDTFGYNAQLPQLLKKSDVDYFMTTKISWSQVNKIPFDTFHWKGIDGTEVLTHMITTPAIGQDVKADFNTTYNGMLHPDAICGAWERYQQKDLNNDILVCFGHGDGGGGATRWMLETEKRLSKGITGIPKTRQVYARQYFEELEERVGNNPKLPVWHGDLYLEYHRGTYTSMARNKRSNRKTELGLMALELISSLALDGVDYPKEDIDQIWTMVLRNQFHDILPGTAINEVYEVTRLEYREAKATICKLIDARLDYLLGEGDKLTLFNPHGYTRNDVVKLGNIDAKAIQASDGSVYAVQQTNEGAIAYVENLPSKGYESFTKLNQEVGSKNRLVLSADKHGIETPFYDVKFDKDFNITSIYDKNNKREVVQDGKRANLLRVYEDKPMYYDNWDIDYYYTEKFWDLTDVESAEWVEVGDVRATLRIVRKFSKSTLNQDIHFYADSRRIDFVNVVEWNEFQHLLKVHFPVNVNTDEATFDIQFGNIKRKIHKNTSWDQARFETCAHKWVDLSEGNYGVSLMNDCKYGHSFMESTIVLSLIKSGIQPNPVSDRETHYFTYSLLPHEGDFRVGRTVEESYNLNQEVIVKDNTADKGKFSLVSVDSPNVVIETVKVAEDGDGKVVRVYESENSYTHVTLKWNGEFSSVEACNLQERTLSAEEAAQPVVDEEGIHFTIKPYEIYSLRIR